MPGENRGSSEVGVQRGRERDIPRLFFAGASLVTVDQ